MAKPHIAVFFGGEEGSYDLSCESGYFACQHIPRDKYQVTPIHVQHNGFWQVPLGSLPNRGPVNRMLEMLFTAPGRAIRALSPTQGLQRLLQRPLHGIMTLLRGRGGDDGTLHATGQALGIPVVGSDAGTSQLTYNKHRMNSVIDDFASLPNSLHFTPQTSIDEAIEDIRQHFSGPVFVKAATQEGSHGTEFITNLNELAPAINRAWRLGNVVVQEKARGTEFAVTLAPDSRGKTMALPITKITPTHAPFYDYLAKRRLGRVTLEAQTNAAAHDHLVAEAESIAREVYYELNCRGAVTIDVVADDDSIDVLDVNTIPLFTTATPLIAQLQAKGITPARFLDTLLINTIDPK